MKSGNPESFQRGLDSGLRTAGMTADKVNYVRGHIKTSRGALLNFSCHHSYSYFIHFSFTLSSKMSGMLIHDRTS